MQLLVERASMTGFLVFDFAARYDEAVAQLAQWLRTGQLHSREDVVRGGLEQFPDVFLRLFRGENTGKLILELTDCARVRRGPSPTRKPPELARRAKLSA